MPLDPYESIAAQFPPVSAEQWKKKILTDLRGEPYEKLLSKKEGIEILPFYTTEDQEKYKLQIPGRSEKGWLMTERIEVDDISTANEKALEALRMGADSILFDLKQKHFDDKEISLLIKNIQTDIAAIYFENYSTGSFDILKSFTKDGRINKIIVTPQESKVEELVVTLRKASANNFKIDSFHFYTGTDYFLEIAKLRAFRWLWKQACSLNHRPYSLFIFSETSVLDHVNENEYNNMLRNTTEAMSAVIGGCDALIINSYDAGKENTPFGRRIARNIHHILQQESYFAEIDDAVSGSYYIEYLTYQLAKKAWEKFISE